MAFTNKDQSKTTKNNQNYFSCCFGKKQVKQNISNEELGYKIDNENNENKINQEILMKHNVYRNRHRVPALVLKKQLCNYAQNYAEDLAKNNGEIIAESPQAQCKYGVHIYKFPSENQIDCSNMVKNWYDEIKNYNFTESKLSDNTAQFTQIIWKDSKRIGVGSAKSKTDKRIFITVIYDPPGNIPNQLKNNIFPPKIEFLNNPEFNDFEIQCLEEHNKLRFLHNCPPLKLNLKLCKYAKEWVNTISRRNDSNMFIGNRRANNIYGENIYCSLYDNENGWLVNKLTGDIPVLFWYSEIYDYDFDEPKYSLKTEHFTQVLWKNSTELGVAKSEPKNGGVYVVANYDPPGNRVGKFNENVFPITMPMDSLPRLI